MSPLRLKGHKYGAQRTEVDGLTFDSQAEARQYQRLCLLLKAGAIQDLVVHPDWPLDVNGVRVARYIGDFAYTDTATGQRVVMDVKGVRTPTYRLKKKLMKALYAIDILET